MKKGIYRVALLCAMLVKPLHPFIYDIIVLKRLNPTTGKIQYFIGLSDFHDKKNKANAEQLVHIKNFLNRQNKQKTKIILEDLSTAANNCHQGICRQFQINSRGGILGGLACVCHRQGFCVENIEYRYCRVAALGPLLNNNGQKVHDFPSACGVSISDISQEVHAALDDIADERKSCAILKPYCEKTVKKIRPHIHRFAFGKNTSNSMADYVQNHSKESTRYALLKKLLTFDSALLDLKLARSILMADTATVIIAITGGSHIARILDMLRSAGFESVYARPATGGDTHQPIDLSILKYL